MKTFRCQALAILTVFAPSDQALATYMENEGLVDANGAADPAQLLMSDELPELLREMLCTSVARWRRNALSLLCKIS